MSLLEKIGAETLQHAPTALGTIIAVEQAIGASVPGELKSQIVVNSILAGAQAAGTSSNVTVSSIATLTALLVGILNATGVFKKKAKAS